MSMSRGCSGAFGESQVESEAAFQQPEVGRGDVQAGENPVEGDLFSVACEACTVSGRACAKSLLERFETRYLTQRVPSGGGR